MLAVPENRFRELWNLGYRRLLSVVPPGADIREAGKRPGRKSPAGWYGASVRTFDATETLIEQWAQWGGGVGIRCDGDIVAIDIDTLSAEWSEKIQRAAAKVLGPAPVRIGRAPKALLVYRAVGHIDYCQIRFADCVDEKNPGLVECLSGADGTKWFVAHGTHPTTKKPYSWPSGLPAFDTLTPVTQDQVTDFFERLRAALPRAKGASSSLVDRAVVDQSALKGNIDLVAAAIDALPNDRAKFGYAEWVKLAAALRGACQDDPDFGMDLFCEFSEKAGLETPTEDPARVYKSIQPPFAVGASYIYELADRQGDGSFSSASVWFDELDDAPPAGLNLFETGAVAKVEASVTMTPFRFPEASTIPKRQWLYGRHYIRKYVTATAAPSAVGKSSAAIVEALAMASGKALLGVEPAGQLRVWMWNGEDPLEELELRITAAMQHYGLTREDVGDRLLVDSGRDQELIIGWVERGGVKIAQPLVDRVIAASLRNRIDVHIMDPFVSTYRGTETNELMDSVAKKWGAIAGATNAAVELVHHTRKLNGAEATVDDIRGGGALVAAARVKRVFGGMSKIEAKKFGVPEGEHKRFFRVVDAMANMALVAVHETDWFEMRSVKLPNGSGDTLIERMMDGESVGVATLRSLGEADVGVDAGDRSKLLLAIGGNEWREDVRASAWVGNAVAEALNLDSKEDRAQILDVLKTLRRLGLIRTVNRTDKNRRRAAYVVLSSTDNMSPDVFD